MAGNPLRFETKGFRELARDMTALELTVDPLLSKELRLAAKPVQDAARQAALEWGGGTSEAQGATARGVRIRRKGLEVRVEQGARKTTGRHPEYGGVQMRHFFEPALEAHQTEVVEAVELVIDGLVAKAVISAPTRFA